jgi:hypothetical protein
MVLLQAGGNKAGAALVHKARFGELKIFTPAQACVGSLIIDPAYADSRFNEVLTALLNRFSLLLRVNLPKQDAELAQSRLTAEERFFSIAQHSITTNIDVTGDFESYWSSRHKEVRRGIRKVLGSLADQQTEYSLAVLRDPAEMNMAVAEHGNLESAGWKGRAGTAIHAENAQGKCYARILTGFAERDQARVYQLRFDGVVVASLLTIVQNGVQAVLKTTFDESMAKYSPGRFIDYLAIADACEDPEISTIENYTSSKSVDRKWATGTRPICDVMFYRHPLILNLLARMKRLATLRTGAE